MATCKYCGGEIEFRQICGKPTPIRISCICGGWEEAGQPQPITLHFERDQRVCWRRPCPNCGERVYFIRHNGGSLWVEELGWPWEKHPCMSPDERSETTFQTVRTAPIPGRGNPQGAIVRFVSYQKAANACRVDIETLKQERSPWIVWDVADPTALLGAIVAFSEDGTQLVHPGHGVYRMEEFKFPCVRCGEHIPFSKTQAHMMQQHNVKVCPVCKAYVVAGDFDSHLQVHKRSSHRARSKTQPRRQYGLSVSSHQSYVVCPSCGNELKADGLLAHFRCAHKKELTGAEMGEILSHATCEPSRKPNRPRGPRKQWADLKAREHKEIERKMNKLKERTPFSMRQWGDDRPRRTGPI